MSAICHKTPYASEAVAFAKLHRVLKNRRAKSKYRRTSTSIKVPAYCKSCNAWHLSLSE